MNLALDQYIYHTTIHRITDTSAPATILSLKCGTGAYGAGEGGSMILQRKMYASSHMEKERSLTVRVTTLRRYPPTESGRLTRRSKEQVCRDPTTLKVEVPYKYLMGLDDWPAGWVN